MSNLWFFVTHFSTLPNSINLVLVFAGILFLDVIIVFWTIFRIQKLKKRKNADSFLLTCFLVNIKQSLAKFEWTLYIWADNLEEKTNTLYIQSYDLRVYLTTFFSHDIKSFSLRTAKTKNMFLIFGCTRPTTFSNFKLVSVQKSLLDHRFWYIFIYLFLQAKSTTKSRIKTENYFKIQGCCQYSITQEVTSHSQTVFKFLQLSVFWMFLTSFLNEVFVMSNKTGFVTRKMVHVRVDVA